MSKRAKKSPLGPGVIEGVVRHKPCGWTSSGKAFREGDFCPRCGEPISRKTVEEVTDGQLVEEEPDEDDDEDDDGEEEEAEDDEDLEDELEEDEDLEDEEE